MHHPTFNRLCLALCLAACLLAACGTPSTPPVAIPSGVIVAQTLMDGSSVLTILSDPPGEFPLSIPPGCVIWSLHPAPRGTRVAIELECEQGPLVQMLDLSNYEQRAFQSAPDVRSHFLAWHPDGNRIYIKTGTNADPYIGRFDLSNNKTTFLPIPVFVYDLALSPDGAHMVYAFTYGIGLGSETWLADDSGKGARQLIADPTGLTTLAQWSPDSKSIAFIRMEDSQTPFTIGQLTVISVDGGPPLSLGDADAGHGYAPVWSPDGSQIAFVVRENISDSAADSSESDLISNIYLAAPQSGTRTPLSRLTDTRVESPAWSPEGTLLVFIAFSGSTIKVWSYNQQTGVLDVLFEGSGVRCIAWFPGK